MNNSVDGAKTLPEQEALIQFEEAKGYEMLAIAPDMAVAPKNFVTYKQLPAGDVPETLHLSAGNQPASKIVIWMGTIFIKGELKPAIAWRG